MELAVSSLGGDMEFQHTVNVILDFFREGFHQGFAQVNAVLGLIIAVIAAFMLGRWSRLLAVALGATIVHLIARVLIPVVANHAAFKLPSNLMDMSYWRGALALYLGYLVVIAVFFLIRRIVFGRGGGH